MSRRSGKTVKLINRALEKGKLIIVGSEASRDYILHTADLMRVKAPQVIVVADVPKMEVRVPQPFTNAV